MGADLQCPLPFHANEYSRDFVTDDSRDEFYALLAKASAVFQVDGSRDAADAAYERIGRFVLEQSDFLIAIWDGEPAAGRGGTTQIVEEALVQNIPVIWLHASLQKPPCVLLIGESGDRQSLPLADLDSRFELRFSQSKAGSDLNFSRIYCAEKQPRFDFGRIFRIFRDLLAKGKIRKGSWRIPDFEPTARAEWAKMISTPPSPPEDTQRYLLDKLCPHYAWADGLSGYYAGLLRASSLATNLLSASAVLVAMLGMLGHGYHLEGRRIPELTEFALIAFILLITLAWPPQVLARALAQLQAAGRTVAPVLLPVATRLRPRYASAAGSFRCWC